MKLLLAATAIVLILAIAGGRVAAAENVPGAGDWEITVQSQTALARGLQWLAENQGAEGNWQSNDLGLVSMGALAFLADGHMPGRGKYGRNVALALDYVVSHAKPSGLLNIADPQRDMYNHGLSTFVLGQAYGMTNDVRVGPVLERALKLIAATQCKDGGWDYRATAQEHGHDLSLAVMQAKALRGAVDNGLQISPEVVRLAIRDVREHYSAMRRPRNDRNALTDFDPRSQPGQFTYTKAGGSATPAMAAAGVVCLQEFGQYDDWRIPKNMQAIRTAIDHALHSGTEFTHDGRPAFDSYTLYYIGQAIYQVGGNWWTELYPQLRDNLVATQQLAPGDLRKDGLWHDTMRVGGPPGDLYATSVACFVLAIPNRYLPILQEGKIKQFQSSASEAQRAQGEKQSDTRE